MRKMEAISDKMAKIPEADPGAPPGAVPATQDVWAELAINPVGHSAKQVLLMRALVPLMYVG